MTKTPPLNIAIVSSEAIPFAKTGGLADVSGTLPLELGKLNHHCHLFLPAYQSVLQHPDFNFEVVGALRIPVGQKIVSGTVLKYQPVKGHGSNQPEGMNTDVSSKGLISPVTSGLRLHNDTAVGEPVAHYLIRQDEYFGRPGLYGEQGRDYSDNCERFSFFCRAVLEAIRLLDLPIDIVHANDWQTGLIPALLKLEYTSIPPFEHVPTIFTIHNLAYQGRFWHWDMAVTGLDWKYFNWRQMEFFGDLSLLKTGIVFADQITTVSPRYAREIQSSELGCGMEGVLQERATVLKGIMNGIDTEVWNPQSDPFLASNYTVDNWPNGKRDCKLDLQEKVGLEVNAKVPLLGLVGRLASQKGWSILLPVLEQWIQSIDVQWVILGTGEVQFENALKRLATQYPKRLSVILKFSDPLAHQIEAGSDIFVMPSQYEPCGLNQLYSLRYGAVPVVRQTGGLADSIVDATDANLANKSANGFTFSSFKSTDLETALARAVVCYLEHSELWNQLVETGMKQDWSWRKSAMQYLDVYHQAIANFQTTSSHPN